MAKVLDDCYFYYYSNCSKGNACTFRHEAAARGSEEMCENWVYGRCENIGCSKRHMQIQVQRSKIQCYWESQPSGCQKSHCVFRHSKLRVSSARPKEAKILSDGHHQQVPSPKVEQILIQVGDTDNEESPQKPAARIKPIVTKDSIKKRITLRNTQDGEDHENSTHGAHGRELLKANKRDIAEALKSTKASQVPSEKSQVKAKSLKELKRERILRARMEHEKKKLIAAAGGNHTVLALSTEKSKNVEKMTEPARPEQVIKKTDGMTVIKPVITRKRQLYKKKVDVAPPPDQVEHVEVIQVQKPSSNITAQNQVDKNGKNVEIKVKTLEQIQLEKRQRLSAEPSQQSTEIPTITVEKQPTIAPRKLKVRSTKPDADVTKARIKLKRKSLNPTEVQSKKTAAIVDLNQKELSNSGKLKDNRISPKETDESRLNETENSVKAISVSGKNLTDSAPVSGANEESNRSDSHKGNNARLSQSEADILESSAYLGDDDTDSPTLDIDDDDLMNEMEQLLA